MPSPCPWVARAVELGSAVPQRGEAWLDAGIMEEAENGRTQRWGEFWMLL